MLFNRGDLVQIEDDQSLANKGLEYGCEGIVMHTYQDKYPGSANEGYCVFIEGRGPLAWYKESNLTLRETDRFDKLGLWEHGWKEK